MTSSFGLRSRIIHIPVHACLTMASSNGKKQSKLFDDVPEPDYDHLNSSFGGKKSLKDENDCKKQPPNKEGKETSPLPEVDDDYILGTLIVRVVAARNLDGGGAMRSPSRRRNMPQYNPYASVQFGGQTQRTTVVPDSVDPLWPRSEAMYMDVALPLSQVTYRTMVTRREDGETAATEPPMVKPKLTIALFSATGDDSAAGAMKKKMKQYSPTKKMKQQYGGDSDDPFLGSAMLDITPLLTGKKVTLDKWLPLSGGGKGDAATVRCVCEYETSDPAPRPGDIVRFTRFCQAADLYPVPITLSYKVQEVSLDGGSGIVLEYTTPEGWICTFVAHRFMVLCEERCSATMLDRCQDEMVSLQERLSVSPILREVQSTVTRVPDEGLLFVSLGAIKGAGSLLDRWWSGGVDTALGDLQYATNWDGRFNNNDAILNMGEEEDDGYTSSAASTQSSATAMLPSLESPLEQESAAAIPGMPCCPITGEPMVDPVVAADGHTYERAAIARWFHSNNKSPLTGSVVPHKHLVPNYVLLSSIQELTSASTTGVVKTTMTATAGIDQHERLTFSEEAAPERNEEEEEDRKMPAV
jgi:hypothetical protein